VIDFIDEKNFQEKWELFDFIELFKKEKP